MMNTLLTYNLMLLLAFLFSKRSNGALDEVEVVGDQLLAVVHDEHSPDIQLDVALGLLVLEEVEWRPLGDEEQGSELQLTLNGEVFHGKMFLPVVGERLVELSVLLVADVVWRPSPDWLCLVQLLVLAVLLFDCLLLLLLLSISILPNVLNLGLLSLGIPGLGLVVGHLLLPLLLAEHLDRVPDELRVLLHHLFHLLLFDEFGLILFHVQDNL